MRLDSSTARERLAAADHGVLGTVHAERGAHLVPVVFALDGDRLAIPIDRVKPKSTTRLQRSANVEADPRATLLVEHWDRHDWSMLWWVRADMRSVSVDDHVSKRLTELIVEKHPQYRDTVFERLLTFEVVSLTGWSAAG